jgi:hypothetical protein
MSYRDFNEEMESDRILIWNAAGDPVISERLALYNYTPEVFNGLKGGWTETDALGKKQISEQGDQHAATNALNESRDQCEKKVKRAKRLARLAFENNSKPFEKLNLKTLNIGPFEDWLVDAESFYSKILGNPEWLAAMENFGYTTEQLQADQEEVQNLKVLQHQQFTEMGQAQQATQDKWNKFKEMHARCDVLREVAKIEFEDDAQHLEKLGILVRS